MPIAVGFMFTGIVIGYLLRNISLLRNTEKTITCTILLLLFIIGISIGSNKSIINNLPHFGWQAVILAFLSTCFHDGMYFGRHEPHTIQPASNERFNVYPLRIDVASGIKHRL